MKRCLRVLSPSSYAGGAAPRIPPYECGSAPIVSRTLSNAGSQWCGAYCVHFDELCATRGLGEAKAAQLRAALELGRRLAASTPEERAVIREPKDVAHLVQSEMQLLDQE